MEHQQQHHAVVMGEELMHEYVDHTAAVAAEDSNKKMKKKRDASALRKAPQAPKRFKSSYICFFIAKQPEIKEELGDEANVTSISKRSAELWKNLPPEQRAHWDDVAAKDKQRYMNEKASYTGPWQVPWKRVKKDPAAPRRPMSAFLFYSMGTRQEIKKENPKMKNTEVSRVLGERWRALSEEERRPFVEKEKTQREKYKIDIAEWRKKEEEKQEAQRKAQAEQPPVEQQQNPYQHHPEAYPPQNPYMYQTQGYPYPYPPGPYQFPTNGKQPVILGPNGMPAQPYQGAGGQPPMPPPPPPMQPYPQYDEHGGMATYEYTGGEADQNPAV